MIVLGLDVGNTRIDEPLKSGFDDLLQEVELPTRKKKECLRQ